MASSQAVTTTELDFWPCRKGKVRDIYDLGDRLLMVATDRISAFDWVLPTGIPDKGRVLTGLSCFWFRHLGFPHHLISTDLSPLDWPSGFDYSPLEGRSMIVRKAQVVPVECVVRGYLIGSGWKDYQRTGAVCGIELPPGLQLAQQLPEPIFTPATKAQTGHDENITFEQMTQLVGQELAQRLRQVSLELYQKGAQWAAGRGIIIADTKFEFGLVDGELILVDEVLTPDSSRFWPEDQYQVGISPPSFDKQFVRDWLEQTPWDKNSSPPPLPDDVVQKTRQKYIEAYERITGEPFPWK